MGILSYQATTRITVLPENLTEFIFDGVEAQVCDIIQSTMAVNAVALSGYYSCHAAVTCFM